MTPKQKAEEMIYKFSSFTYDGASSSEENAIECALIAVDYILNSKPNEAYFIKGDWVTPKTFWIEVKEEINKL